MNNIQDTYRRPAPRGWRERMMVSSGMIKGSVLQVGERTLPNWVVSSSMLSFIIALCLCTLVYGHAMPLEYVAYSTFSVLIFLYGTKYFANAWKQNNPRKFAKNLFALSLIIRLVWVIFSYMFYNPNIYGEVYGYGDDNGWYMEYANDIAQWISNENRMPFADLIKSNKSALEDVGYPVWLGILYWLSGGTSDVFVPLLFKALLSAYCCSCIYNTAQRHFGESTARIAGLFMCFNPYMLFWCSSLLKEAEMIFLCCVFINQTDKTLSSEKRLTFKGLLPGMLAGFALFFFRSALGIVAFLAIFTHVVFVSRRVMSAGKKVIAGVLVGILLIVGMGDRFRTQSKQLLEVVQSGQQETNMQWRSQRMGGNAFAQYASAAVFAPLIFTIPFPTFNMANPDQIMQLEMSGANYIKNILSFFVLIVMVLMLISGEWRRHVFIIAYTCGYLMVLVLSTFAQSGRFHMPIMPMLLLFAAYGIQMAKVNMKIKRWFPIVLVIEVVACLAWNWFKLKGRGMI